MMQLDYKNNIKHNETEYIIVMSKEQPPNNIQEIMIELHKSLYEVTSEYIQRYHTMNETNKQKYIDYLSDLTREINLYQIAYEHNMNYKSDLSFIHITRIKSLL